MKLFEKLKLIYMVSINDIYHMEQQTELSKKFHNFLLLQKKVKNTLVLQMKSYSVLKLEKL